MSNEAALLEIANGKPCPECGAEWSEVYDLEPVDDGTGHPDTEPEGGLEMQHEEGCALIEPISVVTETIDDEVIAKGGTWE